MIRAKVASRGSEFPVPTSWIFEEGDRFLLPPQVQESAFKVSETQVHTRPLYANTFLHAETTVRSARFPTIRHAGYN